MSDTTLRDLVLKRLEADTQPEDEWAALVLAALESPGELDQLLADGNGTANRSTQAEQDAASEDAPKPPRTAFLRSITAQGFRGIGPEATLDFTPGPGLTLVVGRNGSGKSSFAEGLELLLTGDTYRWSQRSKVWRDGVRLEGETGACTLAREWADGAELKGASTWAQVHGQPRTGPEALGWEATLEAYRPFLSYNELGSLLDEGPSKLYDALSKVLGLDALVGAQTALQQARRTGASRGLEAELTGSPTTPQPNSQIDLLKRLAAIQPPDKDKVTQAVQALRHADQRQKAAAQTVAGKSDHLGTLLDHALRFHREHGDGDCPVCGHGATTGGDPRDRQSVNR